VSESSPSFLERHQFLIYRLFSLAGLIPVGAFLAVHLLTNASILAGDDGRTFQSRVDMIHSLGPLLVPVEWAFIFLPMLFHAAVGFVIIANGLPNVGSYAYVGNVRYTLQRATGMIAFAFIVWHIMQLQPTLTSILYTIGILSTVFHFSNGLWTLGITWGLWTSPAAMRRANVVSIVVGLGLAAAGLGALGGFRSLDVSKAREAEVWTEKQKRALSVPGGALAPSPIPASTH
jgi:succinate dehydrogenase / fumarate reductase cytochrome b subunit